MFLWNYGLVNPLVLRAALDSNRLYLKCARLTYIAMTVSLSRRVDAVLGWRWDCEQSSQARPSPLIPYVPFCMGKQGTKRVLEYARLTMGFANVRASRYGIR